MTGGAGNDYLYGGSGNDTLSGDAGNDTLSGDAGSDTYLFGTGDGSDTINNYDTGSGNRDVIRLDDALTPSDVTITRSGNHLYIKINGTSDQIKVANYFIGDGTAGYEVDAIEFADGTSWDVDTVKHLVNQGSDASDSLSGFNSDDSMTGGAGNDYLYGGSGNDTLSGDAGSDTYLFGTGDGSDTINNYDTGSGSFDKLLFSNDLTANDISLYKSGNHLYLTLNDSTDQVKVSNYFIGNGTAGYEVDAIEFSDGSSLDMDLLLSLVVDESPVLGSNILAAQASSSSVVVSAQKMIQTETELNQLIQAYSSFDAGDEDIESEKYKSKNTIVLPIIED